MKPDEDTMEPKTKNLREIEDVISKAIKKVNGRKENDLCKYGNGCLSQICCVVDLLEMI